MKHIHTRFILCAMFACTPFAMSAQDIAENETDSLAKEPLVQVAYRKVAQSDLLGGVSVVNMEELIKKNYNNYSLDNMQGYIGGWSGNSLWAMDDYLVLVDGVPRDPDNVLPTEIEQISFLKGASAVVLYGSRAAKGVIYITTKRGKVEDLKINLRGNTGFYVSKSYPKYLGSAQYMTLYNEALLNDGELPKHTEEDIYHYASGTNPYRYPNVDFYSSDYIKKAFNTSDLTAEITGGNKRARFYTNIGYIRRDDQFKFGEAKKDFVSRLNIRGNIDLTINDWISAYVNANATFYDARTAKGDYWNSAATLRPNRVTPLIPLSYIPAENLAALTLTGNSMNIIDGKYFLGGTQLDQTNVFASYYAAGYNQWTSRQFQFDTGVNLDLARVLKGLSFQSQFAVDYATTYNTSYDNSYAVYSPEWATFNGSDVIGKMTKYGDDKKSGVQNIGASTDRQTIAFSGQFNYLTSVDDTHNLSAMLIAAGYQRTMSEVYHRTSNVNLGLQLGYNYLQKYYAEFGGAAVYSAKLRPGSRAAFSPSVTLGWRLSKENFLADSSVVDDLMVNVSGSVLHTDMDLTGYYLYDTNYNQADGAWWSWYDGALEHSTNSVRGKNEDLTFAKRKELSANVKTSLWKGLITADASFFYNDVEGLPIQPTTLFPSYFRTGYPNASLLPYVNFLSNRRMGFDFNVNLNKRVGEVDLTLGVAGTYYTTKATRRDEINEFAYQNSAGRPIDAIWGLQSLGLFQSQAEIDAAPDQTSLGSELHPGDIKYVDQNNDNVIDERDVVYLGRGGWYGSPFTLGVNLTAKWKNFTFFVLGTGGFGAYGMKSSSYYWVYGDGKYSEAVLDRWTEETKATATYPRLTTKSGSNNFRSSDFWMYKTDRFNIAKVQVTYDFPKSMLRNFFLHDISAYVSGSNLLTISKERKHLEMNVGSAPQYRFYNLGVKVAF